jgi:hypothetical protein
VRGARLMGFECVGFHGYFFLTIITARKIENFGYGKEVYQYLNGLSWILFTYVS